MKFTNQIRSLLSFDCQRTRLSLFETLHQYIDIFGAVNTGMRIYKDILEILKKPYFSTKKPLSSGFFVSILKAFFADIYSNLQGLEMRGKSTNTFRLPYLREE